VGGREAQLEALELTDLTMNQRPTRQHAAVDGTSASTTARRHLLGPRSRVLVTGATGVVGSRVVRRLLDLGAHVVCFVRDHDPATALWFDGDVHRVDVATGRLEDLAHVRAAVVEREVDTIIHLGAQAIVGAGRRDPLGTFESNIRGTWNLLETCRLHGDLVRSIVVASSDKAYGDCEALPYVESTPLAANNPYDVSKACTDLIAQSYARSYAMPIAIARCGNIFGPGDLNFSRLVPGTVRAALLGERPLIRSDGTLVRDYLYVDDAASAYLAMAEWSASDEARTATERAFNVSTGVPTTVLAMTRMILDACGRPDLEPIILDEARGEIAAQHLDSTRARTILGWSPKVELRRALDVTVAWYRHYGEQRGWMRSTSAARPSAAVPA
jgi:CDP-glucose 4,6-dehydratase